jgi:hypothetical protein
MSPPEPVAGAICGEGAFAAFLPTLSVGHRTTRLRETDSTFCPCGDEAARDRCGGRGASHAPLTWRRPRLRCSAVKRRTRNAWLRLFQALQLARMPSPRAAPPAPSPATMACILRWGLTVLLDRARGSTGFYDGGGDLRSGLTTRRDPGPPGLPTTPDALARRGWEKTWRLFLQPRPAYVSRPALRRRRAVRMAL